MKLPRRRTIVTLGVLTVLAVALFSTALIFSVGGYVTQGRYNRVAVGMTMAEVDAILGASDIGDNRVNDRYLIRCWSAIDGYAYITFDDDGRVCWKDYQKPNWIQLWISRISDKLPF